MSTDPYMAGTARRAKLLDQVRNELRTRHYSLKTERAYLGWIKRYIFYHEVRHPAEMGEADINAFLSHLAVREHVSASTQNQALSALLFLYRHVLDREIGDLGRVIRAKKPKRLPVVMTREEVKSVLGHLGGDKWLMASLLYGAGLRLMPACRAGHGAGRECLRLQEIDFARNEITVCDGKGGKDRVTMLPESLGKPLQDQLRKAKRIHEKDLADGRGRVLMPYALDRKYPNAAAEWRWQWVFPQEKRWKNTRTGQEGRHHVHETILQRAVKEAVGGAGILKRVGCHTFRHFGVYPASCGTTHLLQDGYDIRTLQELLGHSPREI